MALDGFRVVCLEPGADNPNEHAPVPAPGPPEGFIDNTVYRYKMVDGKEVLIGTMPAFPEGWDKPNEFNKSIKEESEKTMLAEINWAEIWPKVENMLAEGIKVSEIARTLEINNNTLFSKIRYMKKQGWVPPEAFKAPTINQEFDKAFPPLGPDEEIKPIFAPYGVEIPKQEEQLSQYKPEDNDFQDELPLLQEVKKPGVELGPFKIQLIATLLAEYKDGMIDDQVVLGLTRGILDLQLPEVI